MRISAYPKLLFISWQAGLQYRASVFLWRFRNMLSTIMSLSLWQVVFFSGATISGYDATQMTTYIFVVAALQSIVFATALHDLASRVYEGEISNILLKPINLFGYLFSQDVADKLKNVFFAILELWLLSLVFHPNLILPSVPTLLLFILWSVLGLILNFVITLLFGSMGFWTSDVWGPKFLFFMVVDFTAGKLFPLDILPKALQTILSFTPFPYLSYYQTQLFLNRMDHYSLWTHSVVLVGWCVFLTVLNAMIWKKHLRSYEAVGR